MEGTGCARMEKYRLVEKRMYVGGVEKVGRMKGDGRTDGWMDVM